MNKSTYVHKFGTGFATGEIAHIATSNNTPPTDVPDHFVHLATYPITSGGKMIVKCQEQSLPKQIWRLVK